MAFSRALIPDAPARLPFIYAGEPALSLGEPLPGPVLPNRVAVSHQFSYRIQPTPYAQDVHPALEPPERIIPMTGWLKFTIIPLISMTEGRAFTSAILDQPVANPRLGEPCPLAGE